MEACLIVEKLIINILAGQSFEKCFWKEIDQCAYHMSGY